MTPRFLDSSLHAFFTKFNKILPLIHQPTFVYRDCSAPLLLNAIALGSLFLGTEYATATVIHLTEQILTSLTSVPGRVSVALSTHYHCNSLARHDRSAERVRFMQRSGTRNSSTPQSILCSLVQGSVFHVSYTTIAVCD